MVSLGRGSDALKEPLITELAEKYQNQLVKSSCAGMWIVAFLPLPKSRNLAHQRENLAIFDFELTEDEINQINQLNKADGRIDGQDPNEYEEFE